MEFHIVTFPETISVSLLVIAGAYGNGKEREQKLKEDGYNPNVVQKCVNDLFPIMEKWGI